MRAANHGDSTDSIQFVSCVGMFLLPSDDGGGSPVKKRVAVRLSMQTESPAPACCLLACLLLLLLQYRSRGDITYCMARGPCVLKLGDDLDGQQRRLLGGVYYCTYESTVSPSAGWLSAGSVLLSFFPSLMVSFSPSFLFPFSLSRSSSSFPVGFLSCHGGPCPKSLYCHCYCPS